MAKQVNVRTDKDHRDALEAMQNDGNADSMAEAMRQTSRANLAQRGYLNGESQDTRLKRLVHRVAWLFTVAGVVGLAFTIAYPVPARIPSFTVLSFGVVLYGVYETLETYEPRVSKRLKILLGWSV